MIRLHKGITIDTGDAIIGVLDVDDDGQKYIIELSDEQLSFPVKHVRPYNVKRITAKDLEFKWTYDGIEDILANCKDVQETLENLGGYTLAWVTCKLPYVPADVWVSPYPYGRNDAYTITITSNVWEDHFNPEDFENHAWVNTPFTRDVELLKARIIKHSVRLINNIIRERE